MSHPLEPRTRQPASFSIPAVLAIVCAVGSFATGPGLGLVLAILAIIFGGVGVMLALAPHVRGGVISMISIAAGVLGIIVAIARIIARVV